MNVFELTFFISVLAGPIMGGIAGKPFGVLGVSLGVIGGIIIGLACHFAVLGISAGLAKVGHSLDDPPKNRLLFIPWWVANFTSVIMMILSPVATITVLAWVTAWLKK